MQEHKQEVQVSKVVSLVKIVKMVLPASVAQLDARPTGDQEVAGLTPARLATFFPGDLIAEYFVWSFSPFR